MPKGLKKAYMVPPEEIDRLFISTQIGLYDDLSECGSGWMWRVLLQIKPDELKAGNLNLSGLTHTAQEAHDDAERVISVLGRGLFYYSQTQLLDEVKALRKLLREKKTTENLKRR